MKQRYNSIGQCYDGTRKADPDILSDLADLLCIVADSNQYVVNPSTSEQKKSQSKIHGNKQYLDIGCGSGNYTQALAALDGSWTGVDPSDTMLAYARAKKISSNRQPIRWLQAGAENLPFPDASFDGVLCSLCIHHFDDLTQSFREIARVLAEDGRFVIFTATPRQMLGYWLWHYFPNMMKGASEQVPSLATIDQSLAAAQLRVAKVKPYWVSPRLQDMFLYSGKYRPELYLSEEIRNGISSFHLFCSQKELAAGLHNLEADIQSGRIKTVQNQYRSPAGEYMTIQIEPVDSRST